MEEITVREKVHQHRLIPTTHFIQRIIERGIDLDDIYHIINTEYSRIRLYCNCGKVAYISDRLTFVFEVRVNDIILITAIDEKKNNPKVEMVVM